MRGMGYLEWTLRTSFYANWVDLFHKHVTAHHFPFMGWTAYIIPIGGGYLNLLEITLEEVSDKSKAKFIC